MKKKLLGVTLTLVMALSCAPASLAADTDATADAASAGAENAIVPDMNFTGEVVSL
jgi:hypothetical protein